MAGSFLCLVGVVIGAKLWKGTNKTTDTEVAQNKEKKAEEKPAAKNQENDKKNTHSLGKETLKPPELKPTPPKVLPAGLVEEIPSPALTVSQDPPKVKSIDQKPSMLAAADPPTIKDIPGPPSIPGLPANNGKPSTDPTGLPTVKLPVVDPGEIKIPNPLTKQTEEEQKIRKALAEAVKPPPAAPIPPPLPSPTDNTLIPTPPAVGDLKPVSPPSPVPMPIATTPGNPPKEIIKVQPPALTKDIPPPAPG